MPLSVFIRFIRAKDLDLVGSQIPQVYIRYRINKSPSNPPPAAFSHGLFSGMSTERQQQASRADGRKSRGPTTTEGKLASSRNAITHGMLSATIVLKGESTDRFLGLLAALLEEFQPQTPFEESLIENMAVARWRQMRIWGMEKAGMEHEMRRQFEMSNSTASDPSGDGDASSVAATRAALAFRTLSDDSRSLELINRYDSRYDRQYYRAHRRFVETRDRRTPPSAPPPQPAPTPAMPAPPPEKVVFAKRTPEVIENQAAVSCTAGDLVTGALAADSGTVSSDTVKPCGSFTVSSPPQPNETHPRRTRRRQDRTRLPRIQRSPALRRVGPPNRRPNRYPRSPFPARVGA
jgi:hypothetical protein